MSSDRKGKGWGWRDGLLRETVQFPTPTSVSSLLILALIPGDQMPYSGLYGQLHTGGTNVYIYDIYT